MMPRQNGIQPIGSKNGLLFYSLTFFTTSTINETIDDNHRTLEQFLLFFRNNVKGTLNKGDIP